jgi:alpha-tubulin suppressor-like RCC1 family protein
VAEGGFHNLALKKDGTVVSWGYNWQHQCNVPAGLSLVVAVAAGAYHSLALRDDGTVVSWGHNQWLQSEAPSGLTGVMLCII